MKTSFLPHLQRDVRISDGTGIDSKTGKTYKSYGFKDLNPLTGKVNKLEVVPLQSESQKEEPPLKKSYKLNLNK